MSRSHRRARCRTSGSHLTALLCAVALALAACGSASSGPQGASDAETGKKATGKPIKIGFLSLDVGVNSIPEPGFAQKAAVDRINQVANGINGRPLDVKVCHVDGTPEKNIACANELVQEKVVAVVDGFDYGAGAALPILHDANIPVVGSFALATEAESDTKSFYFGPSEAVFALAPLVSFKEQGLRKVTLAGGDVADGRKYFDGFVRPAATALGLDFRPVYYPVASPNFQSVASTIASTSPDVGGVVGANDEGQCTQIINSMRSVGYSEWIFAGFCTRFIDSIGARAGDVQVYSHVWLPQMKDHAPPQIQEQLETAESDLDEVGDPEKHGFFTYATYAAFMTFADVLRDMDPPLTGTSITAALERVEDLPSFLGPEVTCDHTVWPDSSACSKDLLITRLQPDGTLEPVGGGYTTVSPDLLSEAAR